MYRHVSASRVYELPLASFLLTPYPLCVLGSFFPLMANATDLQEPWFFPYAGSRMHFTPAAFSSTCATSLYGFHRFQGLYATSGATNRLPHM